METFYLKPMINKLVPYILSATILMGCNQKNNEREIEDIGIQIATKDYFWNSSERKEAEKNIASILEDMIPEEKWAYRNEVYLKLTDELVWKMYNSESIRNEFQKYNDDPQDVKKYFHGRSNWNSEGDQEQAKLYRLLRNECLK